MSGGYAKHLAELVPRLAARPDIESLQLIMPQSTPVDDADHTADFRRTAVHRFYAPASRRPSRELLTVLREFGPDVLFVPNFRALFTREWPVVAMVRNMETLDWDDRHDPIAHRVANRLRRFEGRLAVKSSEGLIAVSEYVRHFLVSTWHVKPDRISVVHHGADIGSDQQPAVRPMSLPQSLRGFLFTAGSTKPSRGLEDVLEALGRMPDPRPPLVVAGHAERLFGDYERALRKKADSLCRGATIHWTGLLPANELAWCYQHARVFVMTSRVEACPNIALEAMAFGCASVAADNRPLPEIYGDAAIYYKPRSAASLAAVLQELLQRPELGAELSANARARAGHFTWSRSAEGTAHALDIAVRSWRQENQERE